MTLQGLSPPLEAALEERDNLKIQLHLLREQHGNLNEVLAAQEKISELTQVIHQLRKGRATEGQLRGR